MIWRRERPTHNGDHPESGLLCDDTGVGSFAGIFDLIANDLEILKQLKQFVLLDELGPVEIGTVF
jgi:hypothetical protein